MTGLLKEVLTEVKNRYPSLGNLYKTSKPKYGAYPHITTAEPWSRAPGALASVAGRLRKMLPRIRPKVIRHMEFSWFDKYVPNNYKIGSIVKEKIDDIDFFVKKPAKFSTTTFNPSLTLEKMGVPRVKIPFSINKVFGIRPSNSQASNGATWDPFEKVLYSGPKSGYWSLIQLLTHDILLKLERDYVHLNFEEAYAKMKEDNVITDLVLVFLPFLRMDPGGVNKPRLIWAGTSVMFIIESIITKMLGKLMKSSHGLAYKVSTVLAYINNFSNYRFLSLDISSWDLSQYWYFLFLTYKDITEYFQLPPWVMALVALYNIEAGLVLPKGNALVYQPTLGITKSGSGFFTWVNHIMAWTYQLGLAEITKLTEATPISYGDNNAIAITSSLPNSKVVRAWAKASMDVYGLKVKKSETSLSKRYLVLCSLIYNLDKGIVEPIVARRAKNACCPTDYDIGSINPFVKAISLRAQSYELYYAASQDAGSYKQIVRYWTRLVPTKYLLLQHSDEQLSSLIPPWATERDPLTWVKRRLNTKTDIASFL